MDINRLLSCCAKDDEIDLELLTSILFDENEQKQIFEQIKATS